MFRAENIASSALRRFCGNLGLSECHVLPVLLSDPQNSRKKNRQKKRVGGATTSQKRIVERRIYEYIDRENKDTFFLLTYSNR